MKGDANAFDSSASIRKAKALDGAEGSSCEGSSNGGDGMSKSHKSKGSKSSRSSGDSGGSESGAVSRANRGKGIVVGSQSSPFDSVCQKASCVGYCDATLRQSQCNDCKCR